MERIRGTGPLRGNEASGVYRAFKRSPNRRQLMGRARTVFEVDTTAIVECSACGWRVCDLSALSVGAHAHRADFKTDGGTQLGCNVDGGAGRVT